MLGGGLSTSSSSSSAQNPQRSSSTTTGQATIYLYRFQDLETKQEVSSIDLEDYPSAPSSTSPLKPQKINLKLEDLIGGADQDDFFFPKTSLQPIMTTTTTNSKTPNVLMEIDVLDYINRSNEKHYALMQKVATTRINCKKLFFQYA